MTNKQPHIKRLFSNSPLSLRAKRGNLVKEHSVVSSQLKADS